MQTGIPLVRQIPIPVEEQPPTEFVAVDQDFKKKLELDQVDNTSDYDKPISRATQQALDNIVISGGGLVEYKHTQNTPLDIWVVPHNLGRKPITQVYSSGSVLVLANVVHIDNNNTQIIFDSPQAGFAVLV